MIALAPSLVQRMPARPSVIPTESPSQGTMSVYEIARAVTISKSRCPFLIRWLHQFAVTL